MITGPKKDLLDLIKRKGKATIDLAVQSTGLAKTTLREHFSQLENDAYVMRNYHRSGPGRPTIEYLLTAKGHSLYPSNEPELMREFISYLKLKEEEPLLEDFFGLFWADRLSEAEETFKNHNAKWEEQKWPILIEMLEGEGFMPSLEIGEGERGYSLKACNCPFTEVVKETRLPCELEQQFFEKITGRKVERTSYIAEGDHSCTYCFT